MCSGDQQCVKQCLDGHPEAFRDIMVRYQGPIQCYLVGTLGDHEQAEEAAQETFVRAFFAMPKLRKPESLFPWLMGIAIRVIREQRQAERRRRILGRLWAQNRPDPPEISPNLALEHAVAALAEPYRQVVLLRYYGDRSCTQVAEQLGMPLGTVTKYLSRAYVMLRETLRQKEDRPGQEVMS